MKNLHLFVPQFFRFDEAEIKHFITNRPIKPTLYVNFSRLFLGHHYFILTLTDAYLRLQESFLKNQFIFIVRLAHEPQGS